MSTTHSVGAVAELTGVSVRTLHHYDHIGLVVPGARTAAGYRLYTDADIERLHLALVYRSVGLTLDEIRDVLDSPDVDVAAVLAHQHELLLAQAAELTDTITAVERLMDAHRNGIQLTAAEQSEIFGTKAFDDEYAAEAEQRWGHADAWEQSRRRVSAYTKQDWLDIRAEGDALLSDLARAKRDGVAPGSPRAAELRERHRRSIERFYECEMQRCLARMYVADDRFTNYYDDVEPGLAQFVHDVIASG
jgi:MerR family transcriptional regulator, thiopeptide resistance regulator